MSAALAAGLFAGGFGAGCRGEAPRSASGGDTAAAAAASPATGDSSLASATVDEDHTIRPDGIGRVAAGLTFAQLRARLGPDLTLGAPAPFMVDLDGMAVLARADTLSVILVEAGSAPRDDEPVRWVAAVSPSLRTPEGIGPGSTLAQAAAVWGAPTLSYNVEDESREYARFPGYAHDEVRFRVQPSSDNTSLAGRYATQGASNETLDFDPAGRIFMVVVDLEAR